MRWYADNSELNGIKLAEIPDILIFGGIAVSPEHEMKLRNCIEDQKRKYSHYRAPIKWNFKDLEKLYKKQNKLNMYNELLPHSKEWRKDIFREANKQEFKIIISVIESASVKRKLLKRFKPTLSRFCFSNGLMRYGLHVQDEKPDRSQVILDWPDGGDSKPFDSEYASAYLFGESRDHGIKYRCGKLCELNFLDSIVYTNMHHSTLLQFSDLIVGATREFVECSLGKKSSGFGVDMLKHVIEHLRGYKNQIYGRGLSVSSKDRAFHRAIKKGIKDLLI